MYTVGFPLGEIDNNEFHMILVGWNGPFGMALEPRKGALSLGSWSVILAGSYRIRNNPSQNDYHLTPHSFPSQ